MCIHVGVIIGIPFFHHLKNHELWGLNLGLHDLVTHPFITELTSFDFSRPHFKCQKASKRHDIHIPLVV